ncbi:MAG: NAD-dependent deacylase [Proteobacteria bacterium]|nr:NAD-dependent deacylase [Pseudomonadota bacterium]
MTIDPALRESLRAASRVVALTGAGVSAESGVPTFRDRQTGLWERYDALELATPEAFARDPSLVWGWYEWRRAAVLRAEPNPGHRALAAIARAVAHFALITQNVDDLHERGGSVEVVHLHGELSRPYCGECRAAYRFPDAAPALPADGARIEPPRCARCGGRVRPGVVWFGEPLPARPWQLAVDAVRRCEVLLCVGTSAVVHPAASLVDLAAHSGATVVQVNPAPTAADRIVGHSLRGPAGVVLPEMAASVWGTR